MPSNLLHQVISVMCYIDNGEAVPKEQKATFFANNPQFSPKSIEFNGEYHVIKLDF